MNYEYYRDLIKKDGLLDENWYVLGIDLGTTNSVISYWHQGHNRPEPIDMSHGFGKVPLPSVVQYRKETNESEWVIGEEALRAMKLYPNTTVYSVKRKMGEVYDYEIAGKTYKPEAIAGKILKRLVDEVTSMNPSAEIAAVVVSVPYDFDDAAKKATMRACHLAGISDSMICLIEEPKAAALAYSFRQALKHDEKIMVFDFGGGTLDITVFHVISTDPYSITMKVISEGGESHHGGDEVDALLLDVLYQWVKENSGVDPESLSDVHHAELMTLSREVKERLSGVTKMRVPFTFMVPPFVKKIDRDAFEEIIRKFIKKTKKLVQQTLRDGSTGRIDPSDISRVLLEGGSSSMPWVRDMLIDVFNDEDKIYSSEKPALDISLGATYYAAMKMGLLKHHDIKTAGKQVSFETTVPHDIGFEIVSGGMSTFHPMIRRGTPYKLAKKSQVFTLSGEESDMTSLDIHLLERMNKGDKIDKCHTIGRVIFKGLPSRPSGQTHLKVTLAIEEEGGLVKGSVEDLGYLDLFQPCGLDEEFVPVRHETVIVEV